MSHQQNATLNYCSDQSMLANETNYAVAVSLFVFCFYVKNARGSTLN